MVSSKGYIQTNMQTKFCGLLSLSELYKRAKLFNKNEHNFFSTLVIYATYDRSLMGSDIGLGVLFNPITLAGTPSEKLERKIEIFRIIKLP